jgi:hypothetical protein
MKSVGLLVFILVVTLGYTQAPDTLWTRTYGGPYWDIGYSVIQTSDGGYIIAGSTEPQEDQEDVWILKTDSCGDIQWTKTYGGTGYEVARSIQATADGGYIVIASAYNAWLLKLDAQGDTQWTRMIAPGGAPHYGGGTDVKQAPDGGYIIAANYYEDPHYHACLIKTDSLGNTVWMQESIGFIRSVKTTSDGGYIAAGACEPFLMGYGRFCLWRTDSSGLTLWQQQWDLWPGASCVAEVAGSGFIACGGFGGMGLMRTDANGDTLWTRNFDYYDADEDCANALDITSDNGYVLVGTATYTDQPIHSLAVCIKTDSLGDTLWTMVHHYPPNTYGLLSVQQTSDNGYIMTGYAETSSTSWDIWLVKLASDVGIKANDVVVAERGWGTTTIFREPLQLPEGKKCKVYDITGRLVEPTRITRGIYFIEIEDKIVHKVVKVR